MSSPREALNELKWRRRALDRCEIEYVHRGAPGDTRVVSGAEVREIGSWAFVLDEATIPYHRVLRISVEGEDVWVRRTT